MDQVLLSKVKEALVSHEGRRNHLYEDNGNPPKITIGIGYNIDDRGLPDWCVDKLFLDDAIEHYNSLSRDFKWFDSLTDNRKTALIDMCFMGYKKFLEFDKMLSALNARCYNAAAQEIINSEWAKQVQSKRVDDVVNWILHG